jgi:hypothetical protein
MSTRYERIQTRLRYSTGYYWDNNYGNRIKNAGPSNLGFLLSQNECRFSQLPSGRLQ